MRTTAADDAGFGKKQQSNGCRTLPRSQSPARLSLLRVAFLSSCRLGTMQRTESLLPDLERLGALQQAKKP